jgi:leucine-rich repeat protein SHOC2
MLPALSLDVLESICRPLGLRDRCAAGSRWPLLFVQGQGGSCCGQAWLARGQLEALLPGGSWYSPAAPRRPPCPNYSGTASLAPARLAAPPRRIRLASCCATLWRRADVAGSAALWSGVLLDEPLEAAGRRDSLRAWLARHRAALRYLYFYGLTTSPVTLLGGLEGSGVEELVLVDNPSVGRDAEAVLSTLRMLPVLRMLGLRDCGLRAVPAELSALPALASLGLARNTALGSACEAAWEPLQGLPALTSLDLGDCELERLPGELSVLEGLSQLSLGTNLLGKGGERAFGPLGRLLALTKLDLACCCLGSLPSQLFALTRLASLELMFNRSLGSGGDAALAPLQHLLALTRLDARSCGLLRLPPGLSRLVRLVELHLGGNMLSVEEREPGGFQQLACLGSLTRLVLAGCGLSRPPPSLAALSHLADLDVSDNPSLGGSRGRGGTSGSGSSSGGGPQQEREEQGAWAPLRHLAALTRLNLARYALRRLPQELLCLQALADLSLENGKGYALGLELHRVPAVIRLDLSFCELARVPPQLSRLAPSLLDLCLTGNELLGRAVGDNAFDPLRHLTRLQQLDLRYCQLGAVPPQLAVLRALRVLRLGFNARLGLRREAAWQILLGLDELELLELISCGLTSIPLELAARGFHVEL